MTLQFHSFSIFLTLCTAQGLLSNACAIWDNMEPKALSYDLETEDYQLLARLAQKTFNESEDFAKKANDSANFWAEKIACWESDR